MTRRVYLVGASGSGKTTLATFISQKFGLFKLAGAARTVQQSSGFTWQELLGDIGKLDTFQRQVLKQQIQFEEEAKQEHGGFVSDRAFDCICCQAEYASEAWQTARGEVFTRYLDDLRITDDKVIIFFVKSHPKVLEMARQDGQRKEFLNDDTVYRCEGAIQYILETNEIPHIPISCYALKERFRLVEGVIRLLGK